MHVYYRLMRFFVLYIFLWVVAIVSGIHFVYNYYYYYYSTVVCSACFVRWLKLLVHRILRCYIACVSYHACCWPKVCVVIGHVTKHGVS